MDKLINGVVGPKISITELTGKWKVSQNAPTVNRRGIIEGLRNSVFEETVFVVFEKDAAILSTIEVQSLHFFNLILAKGLKNDHRSRNRSI